MPDLSSLRDSFATPPLSACWNLRGFTTVDPVAGLPGLRLNPQGLFGESGLQTIDRFSAGGGAEIVLLSIDTSQLGFVLQLVSTGGLVFELNLFPNVGDGIWFASGPNDGGEVNATVPYLGELVLAITIDGDLVTWWVGGTAILSHSYAGVSSRTFGVNFWAGRYATGSGVAIVQFYNGGGVPACPTSPEVCPIQEGFETYGTDVNAMAAAYTLHEWAGAHPPQLVASPVRSGTHALRCNYSGSLTRRLAATAGSGVADAVSAAHVTAGNLHGWLYVEALPTGTDSVLLTPHDFVPLLQFEQWHSPSLVMVAAEVNLWPNGAIGLGAGLSLLTGRPTERVESAAGAVSTGTWHAFDWTVIGNTAPMLSNGSMSFALDGATIVSASGLSFWSDPDPTYNGFNTVSFGLTYNDGIVLYDDLCLPATPRIAKQRAFAQLLGD